MEAGHVAQSLAALYLAEFAGKRRGRYRISNKLIRALAGNRRLYEDDVTAIGRALFELGYVLVDMETYLVVLSQRTFASYRRVNEAAVTGVSAKARGDMAHGSEA